eukprot:1475365-Pyramimonas_sp.AAC.1
MRIRERGTAREIPEVDEAEEEPPQAAAAGEQADDATLIRDKKIADMLGKLDSALAFLVKSPCFNASEPSHLRAMKTVPSIAVTTEPEVCLASAVSIMLAHTIRDPL